MKLAETLQNAMILAPGASALGQIKMRNLSERRVQSEHDRPIFVFVVVRAKFAV